MIEFCIRLSKRSVHAGLYYQKILEKNRRQFLKRVAFLTRFYVFKSSGKMRNFAFIKK
jgi:hypothetical protein